jgi:hypothetical protein
MAMGKTANCSTSEVASHCKSLEMSPSVNTSKTSPVYGKGKTAHQPKHPSHGKSHGKGGTPGTPQKFSSAHSKKGH